MNNPGTLSFGQPAAKPAGGMFGAATQPAAGGMFGAATQPAAGGMFGATTQPAAGGMFGSGAQQSTAPTGGLSLSLNIPAASGFGAPATSGFGAPAASGFGAPAASGFGTAAPTGFGAPAGFGSPAGFGATSTQTNFNLQAPQNNAIQQPKEHILDIRFSMLKDKGVEGAEAAKMIIETYTQFKEPMTEGLNELEKIEDIRELTLLEQELRKMRLSVLKLENRHVALCKEVSEMRETSNEQLQHARRFGRAGLDQIKKRTGHYQVGMRGGHYGQFDYVQDEIPNAFYVAALKKLEKRLALCTEDVRQFSLQLNVSINNMSSHTNTYGHRMNVGPKQIVKILQHQNEMFGKVSSHIASLHKEVEIIKSDFLNNTGLSPNIFSGPTFEEKKNKEILDKLKEKNKPRYEQQAQQQQQQPPASSASPFSMPSTLGTQNPFSMPGSSSTQTPAAAGGFGFSAPAGGASTTPLSGFTAPLGGAAPAGFGGLGASTTAGFGGLGAGQTSFGFMAPKKAADDSSIGSKGKSKKK